MFQKKKSITYINQKNNGKPLLHTNIKRMPEIGQFALNNYKALAERIGEKNIISFIAHCDEKSCHIHDKQIAGYLHQHVSIMRKAAILDQVLHDATLICRKLPEAAAMAENTFIDDYNFQRWKDVFATGLRVFMDGIDGATSVAQTSGGGGTSSDMPWRDKDEDYLHWAYRAMRYAHAKHYPGNKLRKSKSY